MTLTQGAVRELAADILQQPVESVERLEDGLIHETWAVAVRGDEYIVQYTPAAAEYSENLEMTVISYQLAQGTGIPVPRIVSDGVESAAVNGKEYRLYAAERLPGTPLAARSAPGLVREAISYLPQIHDLRTFPAPGWITPDSGELTVTAFDGGSWREMIWTRFRDNLEELAEHLPAEQHAEAARIAESYRERVPDDIEPCLCHNDFSPDNILATGEAVTAVLDFDFIVAGHNERDLVKTASAFRIANETDRELIYTAYDRYRDLSPGFRRWEPVYRVTTVMEIVASFFELSPDLPPDREAALIRNVEEAVTAAGAELEEAAQ
ncbi:MAG: aminoglycoside phosphotransferase family protein [Candidatus Nanohaloarchaea archaeon]|nr:aminoglycoside phosphotransferase family protein [Candidatus Nanohaloarchaea archaeon]